MSQTVKYLIKHKREDLYVINKPTEQNDTIKYSTARSDAREFSGWDNASIDMTHHIAIKKTVTETVDYEEVNFDD
ncbi:DUF2483 family protein [Staphylococcus petrasii]|uniref:DUF2483 family protein n=1 Tax=Staphylococcus petrasii TaxID=1276936 RepID=UPI000CD2B9FD|nr:DUF2483 family protein [Staphylococcus petrasii]PNZ79588.1 hypothetical protein CD127_12295 [Staphylococcus petrasii]TGA82467.1 DUF2483 domain-containing protein [Staphylococcus petrasii]SUM60363.1 phage protein [Staphylococcus petrasii]